MSAAINEATLPEIRAVLAPLLAGHAAFDGWNGHALTAAADEAGVDHDIAALAIEPKPMDLIDAWIEAADADMARRLPADTLASMKIRERITALVAEGCDVGPGIACGLPGDGDHGDAAKCAAHRENQLAQRGRHVAAGGRHGGRFQPL